MKIQISNLKCFDRMNYFLLYGKNSKSSFDNIPKKTWPILSIDNRKLSSSSSFSVADLKNGKKFSSPSVNLDEMDKFRKLSQKWWKGDEFLALRNMNQLRVPFIFEAFQSKLCDNPSPINTNLPLENRKLLDIGCGGGILSESLARLGANIVGIDPLKENILAAKNHAMISFSNDSKIDLEYQCCSIEEFGSNSENQNKFDAVVMSEVLEHVDDVASFLDNSIKCLRSGGFLFITTINQTIISLVGAIFLSEYVLGIVPKGTHEYSKFIPPESLRLILKDYNCDVIKIHGMCFNPLSYQWNWTQDQSISYAMMAVKR